MLLLLLACTAQPDPKLEDTGAATTDTPAPDDTGTDPVETGDGPSPEGITAEITEKVATVVRVRWTTPEPTIGQVEYGETASYSHLTPPSAEPTTEHEVLLLGMPADTEVHFRVRVEGGGLSDDQVIRTETLPAGLPTLLLTGEVQSWVGQYQVIPVQGTQNSVIVIDHLGRIVWYDLIEAGPNMMRAMVTHDRQSLVYCLAGPQDSLELGTIVRISWDAEDEILTPFPYVDHDMTELEDGTLAAIVVTEHAKYPNTADRIVEISPTGDIRDVYNAWDDPWLMEFYNEVSSNWTHGNALDWVPAENAYYYSAKEIGTITKIDRDSGEPVWHLNGRANTFTLVGDGALVDMQHQFHRLDDSMVIFDNGHPDRGWSRAVEYTLDEDALTAEEIWSHEHEPPIGVYAKGDVHRFDDGTTQVVWSTAGEIQNVGVDGTVHWQLNTELGYALTFVQVVSGLYEGR